MARATSLSSAIIEQALSIEETVSGIEVTYLRGDTAVPVTAVPGGEEVEEELDDGGAIVTSYDSSYWLFSLSEISETLGKPARGDRIEVPDSEGNAAAEVYELVPFADQSDFVYRDPARTRVRVKAVKVSEA